MLTDTERERLEAERAHQGLPPRASDASRLAQIVHRCQGGHDVNAPHT